MRIKNQRVTEPEIPATELMFDGTIHDIETLIRNINAYYKTHPGPVDAELQELAVEAFEALEDFVRAYIPEGPDYRM